MTQLTADDIVRKQFPKGKSGTYVANDVDDFLDEVADTVRALEARIAELSAAPPVPVEPAVPAFTPEPTVPQSAANLLELAVKMHDEHIAEGRAQAEALVRSAREASDAQLGDLQAERAALEGTIGELREFEGHYRASIRTQLALLLAQVGTPEVPATDGE